MKINNNPVDKYNLNIPAILDFFRAAEVRLNDTYKYIEYKNKYCMLRRNKVISYSFADLDLCNITDKSDNCMSCIFSKTNKKDGIKLINYIEKNK